MLELSKESFNKLAEIIPEYKDSMEKIYFQDNPIINKWVSPITGNQIYRFKPSEEFIANFYFELKNYIKRKDDSVTVSICDGVIAVTKVFKDFNVEAYRNGYNCMGIKII